MLALIVAGLNFWETHQQHAEARREAQAQSRAVQALVLSGEADAEGRVIELHPLRSGQAIQSLTFSFPHDLRDAPIELAAERPRIEADWITPGLRRALESAHARGAGETTVPVVVSAAFVEDGESRSDVSLYDVGIAWKTGFLAGRQIRLTGVALAQRGLAADASAKLERRWQTRKAALAPPVPN